MSNQYDDSTYGVQKAVVTTPLTGSLVGTAGATVLFRYRMPEAITLSKLQVFFSVGGTAAVRQLLVGTATGTAAAVYLGTATLGTSANGLTAAFNLTGVVNANDDIVLAWQGTGADVYNVGLQVWGFEQFTNLV